MTPLKEEYRTDKGMKLEYLEYPNKLKTVVELLRQDIPNAKVHWKGYVPLEYVWNIDDNTYSGPDADVIDTTERGIAVFQYDGASQWRLFYEAYVTDNYKPRRRS
ncbi:hypothetical protein LTR66_000330 [Elasticomyces elasticus]|nr:hypothetical protein LTR66_000330 [Elasticomyces elasticus]